jgi:hypothetical protein
MVRAAGLFARHALHAWDAIQLQFLLGKQAFELVVFGFEGILTSAGLSFALQACSHGFERGLLPFLDEFVSASVFATGFSNGEFTAEDGKDDGLFEVWTPCFALFSHGFLRA